MDPSISHQFRPEAEEVVQEEEVKEGDVELQEEAPEVSQEEEA